jgi:hypothetical protein
MSCGKIHDGDFSSFLEKDVSAVLKVLKPFNWGTHNIRSELSGSNENLPANYPPTTKLPTLLRNLENSENLATAPRAK